MATGAAAAQAGKPAGRKKGQGDNDRGAGSVAGNLTADPDLRFTESGRPVTNIRVASSERVFNERSQEWEDADTLFFDITLWGKLAEHVCEHLQRGDRVVAEGRWTSETWTDKDDTVQERIVLTARDLGPSMLFRGARVERPDTDKPSARQRAQQRGQDQAKGSKGGGR